LLEKTAQDEEQRLQRFDLVLELHRLAENFRDPHQPQGTFRAPGSSIPQFRRHASESRHHLIARQCRKGAKRANSPAAQEIEHFRARGLHLERAHGRISREGFEREWCEEIRGLFDDAHWGGAMSGEQGKIGRGRDADVCAETRRGKA
jgi:hypothetical protein